MENDINWGYVFYGEETYLLENTVKKIKKEFGEKIVRNQLYRTRRRKRHKLTNARTTNPSIWICQKNDSRKKLRTI